MGGAAFTQAERRYISLREYPSQKLTRILYPSASDEEVYNPINVNKDGFIVTSEQTYDDRDKVDIIFFGGSTTESLVVEESLRFPVLAARLLSGRLGVEISSLNAGYSASHSLHSLFSLLAKGVKYEPKIVVLMNNVNDWGLLSHTGSYYKATTNRSIVQDTRLTLHRALKNIKNFLIPNIWSYMMFRRIDIVNLPGALLFGKSHDVFIGKSNFKYDVSYIENIFKSSLLSFISVCRSWGIEPVLMTQMSMFTDYGDPIPNQLENEDYTQHKHYQKAMNNFIKTVAAEQDVLLIDLETPLSGRAEYIYDEVHLNNEGSAKAAHIIADALEKKYKRLLVGEREHRAQQN